MNPKISSAVRTAMADALKTAFDAGSGAATIKFYTGTQPAGPGTAISTQTLLGTLTCSDPASSTSAGVLTFASITQDSAADADGTATWARIADSSGNAVMDVDVSNNAGNGVIKMNTTTIITGGPISISSFTITMPGA